MTFLIDEDLPRSCGQLAAQFGYEAYDVRDVGLKGRSDSEIACYAKKHKHCILTADIGFGNQRQYPPEQYHGIVVLLLPPKATAKIIVKLLGTFLQKRDLVAQLPGKLAMVRFGRVRIRPF